MRGKVAKQLRRIAEQMTIGMKHTDYLVDKVTATRYDKEGEPIVFTQHILRLAPCTRGMYKHLKKEFKRADKAGELSRIKSKHLERNDNSAGDTDTSVPSV